MITSCLNNGKQESQAPYWKRSEPTETLNKNAARHATTNITHDEVRKGDFAKRQASVVDQRDVTMTTTHPASVSASDVSFLDLAFVLLSAVGVGVEVKTVGTKGALSPTLGEVLARFGAVEKNWKKVQVDEKFGAPLLTPRGTRNPIWKPPFQCYVTHTNISHCHVAAAETTTCKVYPDDAKRCGKSVAKQQSQTVLDCFLAKIASATTSVWMKTKARSRRVSDAIHVLGPLSLRAEQSKTDCEIIPVHTRGPLGALTSLLSSIWKHHMQ